MASGASGAGSAGGGTTSDGAEPGSGPDQHRVSDVYNIANYPLDWVVTVCRIGACLSYRDEEQLCRLSQREPLGSRTPVVGGADGPAQQNTGSKRQDFSRGDQDQLPVPCRRLRATGAHNISGT